MSRVMSDTMAKRTLATLLDADTVIAPGRIDDVRELTVQCAAIAYAAGDEHMLSLCDAVSERYNLFPAC